MRNFRHFTTRVFGALVCVAAVAASAEAAPISIQATSITSGDFLKYSGLGDLGGGIGHGFRESGTCSWDGVSRTNCLITGTYVELAGSQSPGSTGTFTFKTTWLGNVPNPIQARSQTAGSDSLFLHVVPPGAYFDLVLSNGAYGVLDFGAQDVPNPLGGVLNWQSFLGPGAFCTGSPAVCSVGQVGLAAGSTIESTILPFNMQINFPAPVPETLPQPATLLLVTSGLCYVAARLRRR